MKPEHIKFIEDNKINFETVALGYTRNIPIQDLQMYEHIYHQYIDPGYVLTYWCGGCVFDMMKRLMYYYDGLPKIGEPEQKVEIPTDLVDTAEVKPKAKKTRKAK